MVEALQFWQVTPVYELGQIQTPNGEHVPPFVHGVWKHPLITKKCRRLDENNLNY